MEFPDLFALAYVAMILYMIPWRSLTLAKAGAAVNTALAAVLWVVWSFAWVIAGVVLMKLFFMG